MSDITPIVHALLAVSAQCLFGIASGEWGAGGAIGCIWFIAPPAYPGGVSLDCSVWRREARQYAMVGWLLLARMEPAQPAGLARSCACLRRRVLCHHPLTSVGCIDRCRRIDLHSH